MFELRDSTTGKLLLRVSDRSLRAGKLSNACLANLDLSGIEGADADLSFSNLREIILQRSVMPRVRLNEAHLFQVDCRDAMLEGADLSSATIRDCSFRQARLGHSQLRYSQIFDADFTGADFTGADLSMAVLRGVFVNANFSDADLRGADLRDSTLDGARFERARLANARCIGQRPSATHLMIARLSKSQGTARPTAPAAADSRVWWKFWSDK
jgi:uncharacterized protein YjbI with pentapeptide repeats